MSAPVREGDILAQKYRVERVLGEGGMGIVVAATHLELDQKVALKFLHPAALEHPQIVERFAREAKAAAKIRSQHVARVIDTGKMENGTPYMVMEYLEGKDLSALLDEAGQLPIETVIDYVLQASEALAEAHGAGIVHRDLKPANLFLAQQPDRRPIVKLLDFGISKVQDPKSVQLTRTATLMGSPNYMSPEQLTSSKDVDARADIWSLGVILYELLGGELPFSADTMPEIVALILRNSPARLGSLRPDMPPALESAIMKCMNSSPPLRYQNISELAHALAPFASEAQRATGTVGRISRVLGAPSMSPTAVANATGAGQVLLITADAGAPAPASAHAQSEVAHVQTAYVQTQMSGAVPSDPGQGAKKSRSLQIVGVASVVLLLGAGGAFVAMRGSSTREAVRETVAASSDPLTRPVPHVTESAALSASSPTTGSTAAASASTVLAPAETAPSAAAASAAATTRGISTARSNPRAPNPIASATKTEPAPSATNPAIPASTTTAPSTATAASAASAEKKNPLQMGIK